MPQQAFNYTRIQARCVAALARAGQSGVLRKPGAETGDDWNPTIGAPTDSDITIFTYRPRFENREGSLVDNLHRRALVMPETGLVINQEDKVAVGLLASEVDANTRFFEIMDVQEFSPGGTVLFWELELRS